MEKPEIARRRDRILNLLSSHGALSAAALAEMLAVTVQTLRSDLRVLDDDGLIRRRHGAAHLAQAGENIGYQPRMAVSRAEKERIAQALAALIPPGASLALGTGTTLEACARALSRHEALTVFTNNLHAVLALRAAPRVAILLAGGQVRLRDLDVIGAESAEFFGGLRADFAVFSVGAVSEAGDLLDFNMEEVRARRAIQDCARQRVLVLDQTKIGRPAHHAFGRIEEVEVVICSGALPAPVVAAIQAAGCRLITA